MIVMNVWGQVNFKIEHTLSTEWGGLNMDTLSTHISSKIARIQDDTISTETEMDSMVPDTSVACQTLSDLCPFHVENDPHPF